jgi:FixJ family two-component response regulator
VELLTPGERQVPDIVAAGETNKGIARRLKPTRASRGAST